MLKHLSFSLALILLGVFSLQAEILTPDEALARAADALNHENTPAKVNSPQQVQVNLCYTARDSQTAQPDFYVFNYGKDKGFAIVSADDRFPALLGYTTTGSFDYETLPPNVKWWIDSYAAEIEYYYANPALIGTPNNIASAGNVQISPMVKTKWNQDAPYNNTCPTSNGVRCVTGCVATAMAQIMNYHQWPVTGTGSNAGVNFGSTTFDWANMLDTYVSGQYSTTQANAVATLMRACGAAVNMQYTSYESGAYSNEVQSSLIQYFDYNPQIQMLGRDYYSYLDWDAIVYNELAAGRPIYYSGTASTGGHAFVCDGFSGNGYYHFNWGWGGIYDGYFMLNALNPGTGGIGSHEGGYNSNQVIIIGIEKDKGQPQEPQISMWGSGGFHWTGGNTFEMYGSRTPMIYNPHYYTISVGYGLKIEAEDDPSNVTYVLAGNGNYSAYTGFTSMSANIPTLPDGTYLVKPALFAYGEWSEVCIPRNKQYYVILTVKNGVATLSNDVPSTSAQIIYGNIVHVKKVYGESGMALRIYLHNVGGADYNGSMKFVIHEEGDTYSSQEITQNVILPARMTSPVELIEEVNYDEGDYVIDVYNSNGDLILEKIPLTLVAPVSDYPLSDYYVNYISPNFGNINQPQSMSTTIELLTGSTATMDANIYLLDDANNVKMDLTVQNLTLNKLHNLPVASEPLSFTGLVPGDYYWLIKDGDDEAISTTWPLKMEAGPFVENGVTYFVDYEADKTGYVSAPDEGNYSGSIIVPQTMGGYTIHKVLPGTFTFASNLESLTLPASITEMNGGELYAASKLKTLTVLAPEPPVIPATVLPANRYAEVKLNVAQGLANYYKQTEVWKNFFMPYWTINLASGVSIESGLAKDSDGKIFAPYYVSDSDTNLITVKNETGAPLYLHYSIDGGETFTWKFNDNNQCNLPLLNGKYGVITIDGVAGVNDLVVTDSSIRPVYNLFGMVVGSVATDADLQKLPAGVYIYKGRKIIVR